MGVVGKVGLEQVQAAAAVVVANCDAHAGLLRSVLADSAAALQGLFAKGAVAVVAEEQARARIAGDENVLPAIVVEIGGHGAKRIALGG